MPARLVSCGSRCASSETLIPPQRPSAPYAPRYDHDVRCITLKNEFPSSADISRIPKLLVAIFRPWGFRGNEIRSQPTRRQAKTARCSAPLGRNRCFVFIKAYPLPSSAVRSDLISRSRWCGQRPQLGDRHQDFLEHLSRHRDRRAWPGIPTPRPPAPDTLGGQQQRSIRSILFGFRSCPALSSDRDVRSRANISGV